MPPARASRQPSPPPSARAASTRRVAPNPAATADAELLLFLSRIGDKIAALETDRAAVADLRAEVERLRGVDAQVLTLRAEVERLAKERDDADLQSEARRAEGEKARAEISELRTRIDRTRKTLEAALYERDCARADLRQANAAILSQAKATAAVETAHRSQSRQRSMERAASPGAPLFRDWFEGPLAGAMPDIAGDDA